MAEEVYEVDTCKSGATTCSSGGLEQFGCICSIVLHYGAERHGYNADPEWLDDSGIFLDSGKEAAAGGNLYRLKPAEVYNVHLPAAAETLVSPNLNPSLNLHVVQYAKSNSVEQVKQNVKHQT